MKYTSFRIIHHFTLLLSRYTHVCIMYVWSWIHYSFLNIIFIEKRNDEEKEAWTIFFSEMSGNKKNRFANFWITQLPSCQWKWFCQWNDKGCEIFFNFPWEMKVRVVMWYVYHCWFLENISRSMLLSSSHRKKKTFFLFLMETQARVFPVLLSCSQPLTGIELYQQIFFCSLLFWYHWKIFVHPPVRHQIRSMMLSLK